MKDKISIREANENDIPVIVELWKEFIDFHAESEPFFARTATGHETIRDIVAEGMSGKKSCVLVAEQDKEIVAYLQANISNYPAVYKTKEYGCISSLAVTRRFRRQGIGERLFNEVCQWFVKQGVHRIEAPVAASNKIAGAFWKKKGFRPYVENLCREI